MTQTVKQQIRVSRPRTDNKREALYEMSDEELMKLFQAGAVQAFDILVERYSERLSYYVYQFVKDWGKAEDLLQDTFLRVYRNRHSYKPIARFSTWLYTIAGNLARSEYRKRKRRQTYSLEQTNRDGEEYELQIPDESFFAPDRVTEGALHRKHIRKALTLLPAEFKEVVVLRDIQQLAYEEIAEITGLPMGTVKSRIHRGRTRLQKVLADVYPFEDGTGA